MNLSVMKGPDRKHSFTIPQTNTGFSRIKRLPAEHMADSYDIILNEKPGR